MADSKKPYRGVMAEEICEETHIDAIPDSVLSLIFSKLEEAQLIARAATVCRRWRSCSSGVSAIRLTFGLLGIDSSSSDTASTISSCSSRSSEESIEIRRRQRSNNEMREIFDRMMTGMLGLRELEIRGMRCTRESAEEMLCSWVQKNRHSLEVFEYVGRLDMNGGGLFMALGSSPNLRMLKIIDNLKDYCGCTFSRFIIPETTPEFTKLQRCVLQYVQIFDSMLELLLRLCPVLEELELRYFNGLEAPTLLASSSLVKLSLVAGKVDGEDNEYYDETDSSDEEDIDIGYARPPPIKCLRLHAPGLKTLTIDGVREAHLSVGELEQLRTESYFKPVFRKTPNLKTLAILNRGWTMPSVLQFLQMAKSATEITIDPKMRHIDPPISFDGFFGDFTELRELDIGLDMFEAFQTGTQAKPKVQLSPLLRKVHLTAHNGRKDTINLLSAILECAPLDVLQLDLMERPSGTFCTGLLKLQAQYNNVSIVVDAQESDIDDVDEDEESDYDEEDDDDILFSDAETDEEDDEVMEEDASQQGGEGGSEEGGNGEEEEEEDTDETDYEDVI